MTWRRGRPAWFHPCRADGCTGRAAYGHFGRKPPGAPSRPLPLFEENP